MFKKGAWKPIPTEMASAFPSVHSPTDCFPELQFQLHGTVDGGKKPNALSFSAWRSIQSTDNSSALMANSMNWCQSLEITGVQLGFGQRWSRRLVHHERFTRAISTSIWTITVCSSASPTESRQFGRKLHVGEKLHSDPIYPVWGSNISLSVKATPPYSKFRPEDTITST